MNNDNAPDTRDAFELVGQEGRIARMARMLNADEQLTDARKRDIVERVKEYAERNGITLVQIGREIGISQTTVSEVLMCKYGGKADKHLRALNNWMELTARRKNIIQNPEFVETTVARDIVQVAEFVAETCKMGVVYGPAQIGKTFTLKSLAGSDRLGHPVLIRVDQSCRSPKTLAVRICSTLKLPTSGTFEALMRRLIARLDGTKRMLMFDEAERATYPALEFVRDLHDQTGCPILIAGKPTVRERLGIRDMGDYREVVDQLASRIVIRRDLTERTWQDKGKPGKKPAPLFDKEDIRKLIKVANLSIHFDPDAIGWLSDRASMLGMGGIGMTAITIYWAFRVASSQEANTVTVQILESVERMTRGDEDAKFARRLAAKPENKRLLQRFASN